MDINHTTGNKMQSQEHLNFINKLNDSKIPRQNQLIANRLFMKNFPRETTSAEIEHCFQTFGPVHDVKIIAKENTTEVALIVDGNVIFPKFLKNRKL
ncbi:unnamed protein product [Rotaria sp. Silwood1]|nr:unnamed protein product [Rotaria sp. Silwood1]